MSGLCASIAFSKVAVECRGQGSLACFRKAAENCLDWKWPWAAALQQECLVCACALA